MKLSEFTLQPRGPFLFDCYIHTSQVASPLGEFVLELLVNDARKSAPDDEMLRILVTLKNTFLSDVNAIVMLIYKQYKLIAKNTSWCKKCGVPTDLNEHEIGAFLGSRSIRVSQNEPDEEDAYSARIYVSPQWDKEHGLYFARIKNTWEKVDY